MALQGTLETFALPDVLRLLASTKKTGCYRLDGDRGTGRLWVEEGQIVAGEFGSAPAVTDPSEVAFELLRFDAGEFVFDADARPEADVEPRDVESVLADADGMLAEWGEVSSAVPSLDHWVALNPELPTDEVTVRADTWISVVAVGDGKTVRQLGALLGLGELPISRSVKQLLDLGLVTVSDDAPPVVDAGPVVGTEPAYDTGSAFDAPGYDTGSGFDAPGGFDRETTFDRESAFGAPAPAFGGETGGIGYDEPAEPDVEIAFEGIAGIDEPADFGAPAAEDASFESFDPAGLVIEEPSYEPAPPPPGGAPTSSESDPTDAAEIARQLANLSPKAAKAVAAAAKATTQAEREAALAEVDETEDPINRDLLLKFLGSVNS